MQLPRELPHLNGTRGSVVRIAYLLLAAPIAVLVVLGLWFATTDMIHNVPATVQFGFRTSTVGPEGHQIAGTDAAAAHAGLRTGDRIVAIAGQPVRAGASEFEVGALLGAVRDAQLALTLRHADGKAYRATLARRPGVWTRIDPMSGMPVWLYVVFQLLARESFAVVMLFASLMLYQRRPRDPEANLFAFALLLLCIRSGALWWWEGSPIPEQSVQLGWLSGWIGSFIAICGFPDGRFTSRLSRIVTAALIGLFVGNVFVQSAAMLGGPAPAIRLVGGLLSVGIVLAAIGSGCAVVLRYRGTPAGAERQQIKWAVAGFCITLTTLTLSVLAEMSHLLANLQGNPFTFAALSLLSLLCIVSLPLGLIVSLLRYRLYDAEATISRSAVYAALTVSLLAVFAAGEKLVEALGQEYFGGELGAVAGGVGAALVAVMITPLHRRLSAWSERHFQRGLVRLRRGLPLLVGDMRETASLDDVAQAVLRRVDGGVRAQHAAIVLGDETVAAQGIDAEKVQAWRAAWQPREDDALDCDRADPRFPLRLPLAADGCGRVGWVLLGPRPDGSFYGREERQALGEVADPVARAFAIVQRREARQAALDARIVRLEQAIARLLGDSPDVAAAE